MKENLITRKKPVLKLVMFLAIVMIFSGCGKEVPIEKEPMDPPVETMEAFEKIVPQTEPTDEEIITVEENQEPEITADEKEKLISEPEGKKEVKSQSVSQPEVKEEPKPQPAPQPEVKEEPKPQPASQPEVKEEAKPQPEPQPEVKEEPKPQPEVKEEPKPQPAPQPENKEETTEQSVKNEIPDQLDMSQIGDIFVSAEEYDKKVSDSEVGIAK